MVLRQELTQETRGPWLATRLIYQWGDQASKTLHWLYTLREVGALAAYLLANDRSQIEPIAEAFAKYYRSLYSGDPTSPHEDLLQLVSDLPMLRLTLEESDAMSEELRAALAQLHVGKAPDPNGFPAKF
ncbi:hypothetical protein NDU88_006746 [Pleurodeles waltl]|uniref:Uncharacterized protein n=1 Tax=Pleurodeles waltl TaxID=8319 RepID=A0AAV7VQR2_PLEWA|nr:hypothetical protein NDU88_006746 [Pleurodeles waltl]